MASGDRFPVSSSDVALDVWTTSRTAEEIAADCRSRLRGDEDGLLLYAPEDIDRWHRRLALHA